MSQQFTSPLQPPESIAASHRHIFGFDLLRAVAIIMVMVDHGSNGPLKPWVDTLLCQFVSCDAVMFLMISGALLLPVQGSWSKFVLKRFKRVAIPFLFWSFVLIIGEFLEGKYDASWMVFQLKYQWLRPFGGWQWFIFIILALYLFMPIISPWIKVATRRQLEYYLFFWLCGGLGVWLSRWMGFEMTRNIFYSFINYMGYCILGYYLMRYPMSAPPEPYRPGEAAEGYTGFSARVARGFAAAMHWADCHRRGLMIWGAIVGGFALQFYGNWAAGFKHEVLVLSVDHFSICTYLWASLLFALLLPVKSLGKVGNFIVKIYSRNAFGIYLCHVPLSALLAKYNPEFFTQSHWLIIFYLIVPLIVSEATRRIPWIGSGGA